MRLVGILLLAAGSALAQDATLPETSPLPAQSPEQWRLLVPRDRDPAAVLGRAERRTADPNPCSIRLKEWKPQGNFALQVLPVPRHYGTMPTTEGPAPPCRETARNLRRPAPSFHFRPLR